MNNINNLKLRNIIINYIIKTKKELQKLIYKKESYTQNLVFDFLQNSKLLPFSRNSVSLCIRERERERESKTKPPTRRAWPGNQEQPSHR